MLYAHLTPLPPPPPPPQGKYSGGRKNGEGCYCFTNADVYEGEFRDDRMAGVGVYSFNPEGRCGRERGGGGTARRLGAQGRSRGARRASNRWLGGAAAAHWRRLGRGILCCDV
jgi:hypothetical protein